MDPKHIAILVTIGVFWAGIVWAVAFWLIQRHVGRVDTAHDAIGKLKDELAKAIAATAALPTEDDLQMQTQEIARQFEAFNRQASAREERLVDEIRTQRDDTRKDIESMRNSVASVHTRIDTLHSVVAHGSANQHYRR